MAEPYYGEIKMFAGNFAPQGWEFCDGRLLPIAGNETLFAVIGTIYGGDGQTTFGLPDLRGRRPMGTGQGSGLNNYVIGQSGGAENLTLTASQMPAHTHPVAASTAPPNTGDPTNHLLAAPGRGAAVYSTGANVTMNPAAVSTVGGGQPLSILPPQLPLTFIIATYGIFPSQS